MVYTADGSCFTSLFFGGFLHGRGRSGLRGQGMDVRELIRSQAQWALDNRDWKAAAR